MPIIVQPGFSGATLGPLHSSAVVDQGWGDDSLFVESEPDFTSETCFPLFGNIYSPPGCSPPPGASIDYTACARAMYAIDQATPVADLSKDLAATAANCFQPGVLTGAYAPVRSPDGDTITAQWYIGGVAHGSTITFNNSSFHKVVRLPDFQYHLEDWLKGRSLTLRFSGGLAHIAGLVLIPRIEAIINAIDVIDPAATTTTSVADARSTSGGNVVRKATVGSTSEAAAARVLLLDPPPIIDERFFMLWLIRQETGDTGADFGDFNTAGGAAFDYVLPNAHQYTAWFNGAAWPDSGDLIEARNIYQTWSPQASIRSSHEMSELDGCRPFNDYGGGVETFSDGTIVTTGDTIEVRLWGAASASRIDQVIAGRRIETMGLVAGTEPASDVFSPGASFDLEWEYVGPVVQEGANVDRSSLFDDVDGLIYNASGDLIHSELGVGNPWTVDTSLFSAAGTTYAIVRGNLDDASYAFTGWQFDLVGGGQIWRYA